MIDVKNCSRVAKTELYLSLACVEFLCGNILIFQFSSLSAHEMLNWFKIYFEYLKLIGYLLFLGYPVAAAAEGDFRNIFNFQRVLR